MDWNPATLWWLATGALVAAELATGTFYLLMVALGCAAGALAAHAGLATTPQLATAALVGAVLAIVALFTAKSVFIDSVLEDLYQANILARITASDVLLIAPILLLSGIGMAAITSYITLRLYVRE